MKSFYWLSIFFVVCLSSCQSNYFKHIFNPLSKELQMYPFTLPSLSYPYAGLEPYIDARTMEIHYTKHHQGYIDNLNKALEGYPEFQKMTLEQLLTSLDKLPAVIRTAVRNNGGGHYAHSLFWKIMAPESKSEPTDELAKAIAHDFGSFANFKEMFTKECKSFFGSGWVWLCADIIGKLTIVSTQGHDVPMNQGLEPLMVFDVWEHAYYLKYQNRRPDYIDSWWNVVNWAAVAELYSAKRKI
jgi:superoxide dismutase, Fe-Mn family